MPKDFILYALFGGHYLLNGTCNSPIIVRPYGLSVRSLRTASPKPTDWEFSLIGLNESIKCSNCEY